MGSALPSTMDGEDESGSGQGVGGGRLIVYRDPIDPIDWQHVAFSFAGRMAAWSPASLWRIAGDLTSAHSPGQLTIPVDTWQLAADFARLTTASSRGQRQPVAFCRPLTDPQAVLKER